CRADVARELLRLRRPHFLPGAGEGLRGRLPREYNRTERTEARARVMTCPHARGNRTPEPSQSGVSGAEPSPLPPEVSMQEGKPSRTAIVSAVMRAAHLALDGEPKILADHLARALSGITDDHPLADL